MSSQGRARGRARGRSRGSAGPNAPPQAQQPRPGGPPPQVRAPEPQVVPGRGRMRGGTAQPVPGAAPPKASAPPQPPTAQLAGMMISANGGAGGATTRSRREFLSFDEPKTRNPELLDKTGSSGKPVTLSANCFRMKVDDWRLYQYVVDFDPPIDSRKAKLGIVFSLRENFKNGSHIFDGMTLFLLERLPEEVSFFQVQRRDETIVQVRMQLTNELPPGSPQALHVYGIFFRKVQKLLGLQQVGRHYFNPRNAPSIPQHHLLLWPGYAQSIFPYENDQILLMMDVRFKILHTNTVLSSLYDLYQRKTRNFKEDATKMLIGQIVMTRYNNKTYRVDDIAWDKNPEHTFETRTGPVSFVEYYKAQYDKIVSDLKQPLLVSRPKRKEAQGQERGPILLVPEFCFMTGLMEETRSNFSIMKDIAQHTRLGPESRGEQLERFMVEMNRNPEVSAYLKNWNISFEEKMVQFQGRSLPAENMVQGQTQFTYDIKAADWSRQIRGAKCSVAAELSNWILISTKRDSNVARDFYQTLQKVGGPMGMRIKDPYIVNLDNDRTDSYLNAMKDSLQPDTELVVCVVPSNRKDRYDSIKKYCVAERPIPSQVVVSRTISKKQMLMSVATKIALQLNCKLGGELWAVAIPMSGLMVVGIDVYHDSSVRGRSILGFVASMNKTLTKYYSRCQPHDSRQEIADSLKTMMTAALKRYREVNKALPEKVIVYRDGVGDGQTPVVLEHEVPQVKEALNVQQGHVIKLAFVIVKKRINNRFFAVTNRGLANPLPGTVVDTCVTKPQSYDFFLVSQSVRQGTVSPTAYNVIFDKSGLKPDHMQRLAYKLTHLYYNWPGTIRVPAPCLYAHKLAFLIGQSVHTMPGPELLDTLFYL